ncbi:uncharacterized protein LOC142168797 [Nicotiana tabacum]|uniref:Uncharacterized protein LOC142168797 n=1 Tax=Nicotiana tabacum TaxID=4097 RepID=A0AC58SM58_TOBAC
MAALDNTKPERLGHNNPLFLNSNDNSGAILISLQLRGPKNYSVWSRAMRIAILGRNKLGFIDDTCKKENYGTNLVDLWEHCNAIILSWLMNCVLPELLSGMVYSSNANEIHREIATARQGTSSILIYFSKLRVLWAEFDSLAPIPGRDAANSCEYVQFMERQKLLQFLMGLNESYK